MWKRSQSSYGKTPVPDTPYQRAKQVVDDRLGSALVRGKNWRVAFFGQTALCAILAAGFVWQGSQATIMPYVIELDANAGVKSVSPLQGGYQMHKSLVSSQGLSKMSGVFP